MLREQIEEAIDAARGASLRPLEHVVMCIAQRRARRLDVKELNEVRNAVVLAIAQEFAKGTTTCSIATKLGRMIENKVADVIRKSIKERKFIDDCDPDSTLSSYRAADDVAAEVEDQDACAFIEAKLEELKSAKPRYYEALYAAMNDLPVAHHLTKRFGSITSEAASRKILERARSRLSALLVVHGEGIS